MRSLPGLSIILACTLLLDPGRGYAAVTPPSMARPGMGAVYAVAALSLPSGVFRRGSSPNLRASMVLIALILIAVHWSGVSTQPGPQDVPSIDAIVNQLNGGKPDSNLFVQLAKDFDQGIPNTDDRLRVIEAYLLYRFGHDSFETLPGGELTDDRMNKSLLSPANGNFKSIYQKAIATFSEDRIQDLDERLKPVLPRVFIVPPDGLSERDYYLNWLSKSDPEAYARYERTSRLSALMQAANTRIGWFWCILLSLILFAPTIPMLVMRQRIQAMLRSISNDPDIKPFNPQRGTLTAFGVSHRQTIVFGNDQIKFIIAIVDEGISGYRLIAQLYEKSPYRIETIGHDIKKAVDALLMELKHKSEFAELQYSA